MKESEGNNQYRQQILTPIALQYVIQIVPKLMEEAFDAYNKQKFPRTYFQVSISEYTNSTAGILLSVIALESYRNLLCYHQHKPIQKHDVTTDLCDLLLQNNQPDLYEKFHELLDELFIVRDVIAHNHMFLLDVAHDTDWQMTKYAAQLLEGYGDKKYNKVVNEESRTTRRLGLNVQPLLMSFEDLFKVLLVIDLILGIPNIILSNGLPLHIIYKTEKYWVNNLSELLTYYYVQIPNKDFMVDINKLSDGLRLDLNAFLSGELFINNICPKCSSLGFKRHSRILSCISCGYEIKFEVN